MRPEISVRVPEEADFESVVTLVEENTFRKEQYEGVGFLELPPVGVGEYRSLCKAGAYLRVAHVEDQFAGFLLAQSSQNMQSNMQKLAPIEREICTRANTPFLYIERVAVCSTMREKGVGGSLLKNALTYGRSIDALQVWAVTAHRPRKNVAMVGLLEQYGFRMADERAVENELAFGLYCLCD